MLPLSKCGNAGRIAQWILGEIEDSLDYWQHGNGVTSAKSCVKLAIGDTVVTLENKWWGVRGSITRGYSYNSLLAVWYLKYLWAPVWLRETVHSPRNVAVLLNRLKDRESFSWDESEASERLRATIPHGVY